MSAAKLCSNEKIAKQRSKARFKVQPQARGLAAHPPVWDQRAQVGPVYLRGLVSTSDTFA